MPDNCEELELPVVEADFCTPNINYGQVDEVYIGVDGNPFTDWNLLTEWNARKDNDDTTDATKLRYLHVVGDKPAPEKTELKISKKRKVNTEKKHTINIKVDETGDKNYNLVKWLEENVGAELRVWYSAGKYLYGGNEGVQATIDLDDVIPESDEELNTFIGAIKFEGGHPERILNPMA